MLQFLLTTGIILSGSSSSEFTVSTKMLLNEYRKAKEISDKQARKFELPANVVAYYGLQKADDDYLVRAFVKVDEAITGLITSVDS